jgi:hypothetical protein
MKFIILLLSLMVSSCGTETGNPFIDYFGNTATSYNPGVVLNTDTAVVVYYACSKLTECNSSTLDYSDCETALLTLDTFDTELGLVDGVYTDNQAILDAEDGNTITPNETESAQCLSDLLALGCSDSEVTNAFDSNSPSDFSNAHQVIPAGAGSCNDMF